MIAWTVTGRGTGSVSSAAGGKAAPPAAGCPAVLHQNHSGSSAAGPGRSKPRPPWRGGMSRPAFGPRPGTRTPARQRPDRRTGLAASRRARCGTSARRPETGRCSGASANHFLSGPAMMSSSAGTENTLHRITRAAINNNAAPWSPDSG